MFDPIIKKNLIFFYVYKGKFFEYERNMLEN